MPRKHKINTKIIQIDQVHPDLCAKLLLEVHLAAILKNGRHLGFLCGQSSRFAKYTLESHHAKYFAGITICTILLQYGCYLLCYLKEQGRYRVQNLGR